MSVRIFALDGGTYYHHESLHGARYRNWFHTLLDLRGLPFADLSDCDLLLVTCRSHPEPLRESREVLARFLASGGTVVAMGETQAHTWLPCVSWSQRPTNFWWWLEHGASAGYKAATPGHPVFNHITLADATWHYHGVFTPPHGSTPLIALEQGGGALLYEDEVTTSGRMVITSLDPFYHHGSHFMPATTRFLDGFLPWLSTLKRRVPPLP